MFILVMIITIVNIILITILISLTIIKIMNLLISMTATPKPVDTAIMSVIMTAMVMTRRATTTSVTSHPRVTKTAMKSKRPPLKTLNTALNQLMVKTSAMTTSAVTNKAIAAAAAVAMTTFTP